MISLSDDSRMYKNSKALGLSPLDLVGSKNMYIQLSLH